MKEIFEKHEGIIDLIAVDTGAGETYIQPRMQSLLTDVEASKSHAIGVGGTVQRATVKGRMIVHLKDVTSGKIYYMDLGMGHVLNNTPVSILSVSKLIPTGMIFHFEHNNNYCTLPNGNKVQLILKDGLFFLPLITKYKQALATLVELDENEEEELKEDQEEADSFWPKLQDLPKMVLYAHAKNDFEYQERVFLDKKLGVPLKCMATFATWHERLNHISHDKLRKIVQLGAKGMDISGNTPSKSSCNCQTCRLARAKSKPQKKGQESEIRRVGQRVSTDLKTLPHECLDGMKYVIPFVDHYSTCTRVYFSADKRPATITKIALSYIKDMKDLYGVEVKHISTDRGQEYHQYQDADTINDASDAYYQFLVGEFTTALRAAGCDHTVQPVSRHETVVESWFARHSDNVDALLSHARLSGVFACYAYSYSCYVENRLPCLKKDRYMSPIQILTKEVPDLSLIKVFGCDSYEKIPNDPFAKYPGITRGRKLLFMGYMRGRRGACLFDPVERKVITGSENVVFVENMADRKDALRAFDSRRRALKVGKTVSSQPLQLDDFVEQDSDPTTSSAVRRLFTHPEEDELERDDEDDEPPEDVAEDHTGEQPEERPPPSPMHSEKQKARRMQKIINDAGHLRPVRMVRVGKRKAMTPEEQRFIRYAKKNDVPVVFHKPNPKRKGTGSHARYSKYFVANTLNEAEKLGMTNADFTWDWERGWITMPTHEPDVDGHVYDAVALCVEHDLQHTLDALGVVSYQNKENSDYLLAACLDKLKQTPKEHYGGAFHEMIRTAFDPAKVENTLSRIAERNALADEYSHRLVCLHTMAVEEEEKGWNLDPEPKSPEDALDENNLEAPEWRKSMNVEIDSMVKYGVFTPVNYKEAAGKQILSCRWVYKRKINSEGKVVRYRSRLVAGGHRQVPYREDGYGSFDADRISSPVVSKDGLRIFLSMCAGYGMRIRQLDVSAAFLQADLEEEIYVRAPRGFEGHVKEGEVLKVRRGLYGLKQGSSSWYRAISEYLTGKRSNEAEVPEEQAQDAAASTADEYKNGENPDLSYKGKLEGLGFTSLVSDPCLFERTDSRGKIMVALYVDDISFAATTDDLADEFLEDMRKRFTIGDEEGKDIEWLLAMRIKQDLKAGTVSLSQELYIELLADKFLAKTDQEPFIRDKIVKTPMCHTTTLRRLAEREVPKSQFDYLSFVGCCLHLVNCSRPDIATAVGILARHANAPGAEHVKACKRLMHYLWCTRTWGITYSKDEKAEPNTTQIYANAIHPLDPNKEQGFTVFADASYADSPTRRSTLGHVVMMNNGPVSWSSTLMKTVALSTAESEIGSAVESAKTGVHLRLMVSELSRRRPQKVIIMEDNTAAISMAGQGIRHVRNAKHFEVRLRYLQELVDEGKLELRHVSTNEQLGDSMTKPLDETKFEYFRSILMKDMS